MRPGDFAAHAFEWLRERIPFDQGVIVTSRTDDPTWLDAHFAGVADPRGLMENYAKVRHLDVLSQRMLSSSLRAHRIDVADPEIAGPRFTLLREHFLRFNGIHILGIAVPVDEGAMSSVFMLVRGEVDHRFEDEELEFFELFAPHFAEAAAINRLRWLLFREAAPDADALPVALLSPDGRFTQMTAGFARLFWPEAPPVSAYLPESIFAELRRGRASQLPDGRHSLYGQPDDSGGWLLRIRSSGPLDRLTPRQRQIAAMFARGVQCKEIADELELTLATVRNHLQNIYQKLGVHDRDSLAAVLVRP